MTEPKKEYMTPKMEVVKLKLRASSLLQGSVGINFNDGDSGDNTDHLPPGGLE